MHTSEKPNGVVTKVLSIATSVLIAVVGWLCIAVYDHADRLARVETQSGALMVRLDRIEEKLDRLIERIPR